MEKKGYIVTGKSATEAWMGPYRPLEEGEGEKLPKHVSRNDLVVFTEGEHAGRVGIPVRLEHRFERKPCGRLT